MSHSGVARKSIRQRVPRPIFAEDNVYSYRAMKIGKHLSQCTTFGSAFRGPNFGRAKQLEVDPWRAGGPPHCASENGGRGSIN